ncbi:uncharacterized protein LOC133825119 [Humulus lupulus]|uniref:uncharacterized protein LOC133825119 n=1 Tax=Humulus lupulus TaxID=3486 RepID=UPI002B40D938|nr:uncharacterized protein LOC133825119 [Humulus lupulus]
MVRDADDRFVDRPEEFVKFLGDAEKPIFPGSPMSKLVVLVKLYNLKAGSGWSDISFTKLLDLVKEILPKDNEMPSSLYEAKKTLCTLGMDYKKIHACPNDCVLYRNNLENATECPTCKTSRWKRGKEGKKRIPAKVLWYLPPIPRFIRLFRNLEHAKSLRWHEDGRIKDDKLRHPAYSLAWETIDEKWPVIKKDPRNLRLGLLVDGINPFSRSKQPGNDVDVYLAPLIDDLKLLWDGVDCYDSFSKESFILRGLLLWTINDFPAYGNLSGCYVKGYKGCPICGEQTSATRLKFCKKTCTWGIEAFNGKQELRGPPPIMTGAEIYEEIRLINNRFGKPVINTEECEDIESRVKSKGKSKMIRHNLDVMHIEKNICDSLIGTLLNIPRKTKDSISARRDPVLMSESKKELAPKVEENRTYLPPACYTLKKDEKHQFCETLAKIKVPDGFSSNIRNLVSLKDCRLQGLKSHDCHVLMQQMLPIAIQGLLENPVRNAITRMCFFFNALCSKVIDVSKLEVIQLEIVKTLCFFEQYFPPSFFDIMVHLAVHLVREVTLCGPVCFRWMYPFERLMKVYKGYVRNRSRPEGCIVESYIAEEVVEFCSEYMVNVDSIGIPIRAREGVV